MGLVCRRGADRRVQLSAADGREHDRNVAEGDLRSENDRRGTRLGREGGLQQLAGVRAVSRLEGRSRGTEAADGPVPHDCREARDARDVHSVLRLCLRRSRALPGQAGRARAGRTQQRLGPQPGLETSGRSGRVARLGAIHQRPRGPIRQGPTRVDLGPLQRAGQLEYGREESAVGGGRVSLVARGRGHPAANRRRLCRLRQPHVQGPDGDVRRGLVPRLRAARGHHQEELDLPRVQPPGALHGMAFPPVEQHIRDDPADLRRRPYRRLSLGFCGRPDADLHALGLEEGRPHARALAARRDARRRQALPCRGVRPATEVQSRFPPAAD